MGNIPDKDYEINDYDKQCWAPGLTPKYIKLTFTGVTPCPPGGPTPNGSYIVPIAPGPGPAIYATYQNDWFIGAYFDLLFEGNEYTNVFARYHTTGPIGFAYFKQPICTYTGNSHLTIDYCNPSFNCYGGSFSISWGPGIEP